MQAWVSQARETIVRMTGLSGLTALDFTDDRLTTLLKRLSKAETWQLIERPVDGGAVPRRGQLLRLRPSCAVDSSHPAVKFIRIDGAGRACTVPSRRAYPYPERLCGQKL